MPSPDQNPYRPAAAIRATLAPAVTMVTSFSDTLKESLASKVTENNAEHIKAVVNFIDKARELKVEQYGEFRSYLDGMRESREPRVNAAAFPLAESMAQLHATDHDFIADAIMLLRTAYPFGVNILDPSWEKDRPVAIRSAEICRISHDPWLRQHIIKIDNSDRLETEISLMRRILSMKPYNRCHGQPDFS